MYYDKEFVHQVGEIKDYLIANSHAVGSRNATLQAVKLNM